MTGRKGGANPQFAAAWVVRTDQAVLYQRGSRKTTGIIGRLIGKEIEMKFTKPKIKEKCRHCGAKWKGDGWTQNCPNCGASQGNQ